MAVRIDRETFLKRAMERFGHHYSYEGIDYRSYRTPVKIRCTEHPVRLIVITPERHLQTTGGCKYCLRRYRQQTIEASVTVASVTVAAMTVAAMTVAAVQKTQQPSSVQAEGSVAATGAW